MKASILLYCLCIASLHSMQQDIKGWSSATYNQHHQASIDFIKAHLNVKELPERPEILHVGCGTGTIINYLKELIPNSNHIQGIDKSRPMICQAKEAFHNTTAITFDHFDERKNDTLPCKDQYDFIFSYAYLNWIRDQEKFFNQMVEWLAKDGILLLSASTSHQEEHDLSSDFFDLPEASVKEWCKAHKLTTKTLIIEDNKKGLPQLVLVATKPYRSSR